MRWIKESEAQERLPELIEEVAQGGTVVILRGGVKIAQLIPDDEATQLANPKEESERRRKAVDNLRDRRRKRRPTGITTEEILEWRRGDPFQES